MAAVASASHEPGHFLEEAVAWGQQEELQPLSRPEAPPRGAHRGRQALAAGAVGLMLVAAVAAAVVASSASSRELGRTTEALLKSDSIQLNAASDKKAEKAAEKEEKAEKAEKGDGEAPKKAPKEEAPEKAEPKCTVGRNSCKDTQCCDGPGMQCYEQDESYAQCRPSCIPGPDPTHWDGKAWSCKELGQRTAGEDVCGNAFGPCLESKCCKDSGYQCYGKNSTWAVCKVECVAGGPDISDGDSKPWSCEAFGERTPTTQAWVQSQCSAGLDNCVGTRCCKNAGEQCALQNDYYGNCMIGCVGRGNGDPWSCKKAGARTPAAPIKAAKLAPWVTDKCSSPYKGCKDSKCCLGMNMQCYEKNEDWAMCMEACDPKKVDPYDNKTWSCKERGPRSYGMATKGFPSLYCFSLLRTSGYEVALLQAQLDKAAGIFACDDYSLLTADGDLTLKGATGLQVKSIKFPGAPVVTSQDGTAGNTQLFVHAWDAVVAANVWQNHAFTVKVDPDAVMIPERLRWHLAPHVGEHIFVLNCNKYPGPNYPMVYGALEVFAHSAIQVWAARGHDCAAPNTYGEDYYMTRCMDSLGVGRFLDERVLGDNLCMGADCNNGWISTFHPFKDVASWEKCWNAANAKTPTATV